MSAAIDSGGPTHAFGLGLDLTFPVSGLEPATTTAPLVQVRLAPRQAIDKRWRRNKLAERLVVARQTDGSLAMTIDASDDEHRVWAEGHGLYLLSPGRRCVECAPPPATPAWRWQRLLIGHVLPLAAVLEGLEVIHASAVSLDGRVAAFVGGGEAGKTSLAVNLALRGAGFVCDDVLALETTQEDSVVAHPGAGICNLRQAEANRLAQLGLADDLAVLGEDDQGLRVAVQREERPLPLDRIYFLDRSLEDLRSVRIEETRDAGSLLGSTFNLLVRSPERLTRQLDVSARVAATSKLFRLEMSPGLGAAAAAEAVEAHARMEP
jgi:hypothetical protein